MTIPDQKSEIIAIVDPFAETKRASPDQKNKIITLVHPFYVIGREVTAYYQRSQWRLQSDNVYFLDCATAVGHQRALYVKVTPLGPLYVYEISPKQWVAYRGEQKCELLLDNKIAAFKTPEEAQRMADAHLNDGYPNSAVVNDGYRWLPEGINPMPVTQGKRKSKR